MNNITTDRSGRLIEHTCEIYETGNNYNAPVPRLLSYIFAIVQSLTEALQKAIQSFFYARFLFVHVFSWDQAIFMNPHC